VAEQERGSDDPQLSAAARHALHDEELIAAFAAGDVEDAGDAGDAERAASLVQRCSRCRDLHADLGQIRTATRASGSAEQRAAAVRAPRDFRLTAEDAARLRPGTPIRRIAARLGWRARLGGAIAAFGRPLGAAMATLGVVGILVASLTLGGGPLATMSAGAGSTAAPVADQLESVPHVTGGRTSYGPLVTGEGEGPRAQGNPGPRDEAGSGDSVVLLGGSIAFLLLGVGLIVIARREGVASEAPRGN
jgi:hypothetical protein